MAELTTAPGASAARAAVDVRLRLLGGFELTIDGSRADLQPACQRLLAFVALATRGVDRAFAALQLWPDKTEERSRANLRSTLWRLGRLPVDLVDATKVRLALADSMWVDTRQGLAELASARGEHELESWLPFQALDSALLPDWYDDWLVIERERLRQLRLGILEDGARRALAAGRAAEAIQIALAAASMDPLRETPHRIVIEAHRSESNDSEALAHYRRYRELLGPGSPLAPSDEMLSLLGTVATAG